MLPLARRGDDPPSALRQAQILLLELLEAVSSERLRIEGGDLDGVFIFDGRVVEYCGKSVIR